MSRYRVLILIVALVWGWSDTLLARQDTLYMSVLNSRKHRLGALDNPTVGLFVSTDAGATWKHRGWTGYVRTFYTEAGSDGVLWSACGNGVLRSRDKGVSWRITTGWEITEVLKVKVDPSKPAVVYAATAYGVFRTENSGETWKERNVGFSKPFVADIVLDGSNTNRLLAASEDGVYLSTNAGKRWQLAGLKGKGVRTVLQHPTEKNIFFAGTEEDGFFVSSNRGKTWHQSNMGLTQRTVYTIACDRSNAEVLYVGTHGGGVYRSSDRGKTWRQLITGLDNLVVHSLLVLPSDPSILFAATLNGGLFKSTDRGEHWSFNSQEEGQVWGLSAR
jgi:photosystem II stability/assembly factor-like uncharacterized protein